MAYSSVPITTLSHLIEVLQAACVKCQPQIPGVAPATGEANAPISDHDAIRLERNECVSACPTNAAVIIVSTNEAPVTVALSGGISRQPDDGLVSPTPDPTIAAVSSWDSPYISSQERHQVPDPAPALPPIESASRLRAKGAAPLVKPSVFSLHNPKTLVADRLGSPQVISLAYRHESCSIHIRGHPPPSIPL